MISMPFVIRYQPLLVNAGSILQLNSFSLIPVQWVVIKIIFHNCNTWDFVVFKFALHFMPEPC